MAKEEEPDPVVNPQKSSIPTLKASVKKGSKKPPSRSSKKERTNLKTEEKDFKKFMKVLNQIEMAIPLVEALEQMPSYAKFL
ncbi:hypothetical protein L195_g063225, partial [Trifolium pratense]